MTVLRRLVLVASAAVVLPACSSKAQAIAPAPPIPLDVPAPPPRVVVPITVKVPEPPPPEPDPAAAVLVRPPAPTVPPARPPDVSPPATPPPVLQTTSNTAAIEQKARDLVAAARRDLARVDRRKLGENARDQFDTAQRFIRMADDALTMKNYLYAQQLAESAAALAGGLVK